MCEFSVFESDPNRASNAAKIELKSNFELFKFSEKKGYLFIFSLLNSKKVQKIQNSISILVDFLMLLKFDSNAIRVH